MAKNKALMTIWMDSQRGHLVLAPQAIIYLAAVQEYGKAILGPDSLYNQGQLHHAACKKPAESVSKYVRLVPTDRF